MLQLLLDFCTPSFGKSDLLASAESDSYNIYTVKVAD